MGREECDDPTASNIYNLSISKRSKKENMSTKDKKKKTSKLCKLLEIAGIDGEGGVSIRRPDLLNDLV